MGRGARARRPTTLARVPHPFPAQTNVAKILKCAGNDDVISMKAEDDGDTIGFTFESEDNARTSQLCVRGRFEHARARPSPA